MLDLPTYPKIWRHIWMLPNITSYCPGGDEKDFCQLKRRKNISILFFFLAFPAGILQPPFFSFGEGYPRWVDPKYPIQKNVTNMASPIPNSEFRFNSWVFLVRQLIFWRFLVKSFDTFFKQPAILAAFILFWV
jgi:hypothetical protein